jgi:hypothetical protein
VLLVLADHAHDDGSSAFPSISRIGRKARLSRRGVYDALKRLKVAGAIVPVGAGPKGTVSYRVVMEAVPPVHGAATAPVQPEARRGAATASRGVQRTAPEPSLGTVPNRQGPRVGAKSGQQAGMDQAAEFLKMAGYPV